MSRAMNGRLGRIAVAGVMTLLALSGSLGCERQAPAPPPALPPPRLPPSLDGTGTVQVRVISGRDQKPLVGAMVAVRRSGELFPIEEPLDPALTDGEGIARISSVPAGELTICARGARHQEFCEEHVGLVAGGTVSSILRPSPGASIRGQVLLADGSPAAGLRLVAVSNEFPPWPRMHTQAMTDVVGHYQLDGVTPGRNGLLLFAPVSFPFLSEAGYLARDALVVGEMDVQMDIHLKALVPVAVKPCHSSRSGKALNLEVSNAFLTSDGGRIPLTRQEEGHWIGRVEAGVYTAEAHAHSGTTELTGEREVDVRRGAPVVIPVSCKPIPSTPSVPSLVSLTPPNPTGPSSFEFAGHVLLPDGTPATGARIIVFDPDSWNRHPCSQWVPPHRHVRFEGSGVAVRLDNKQREVIAWLDKGLYGGIELSNNQGERVVADIRVKEAGAIVGRVDSLEGFTDFTAPQVLLEHDEHGGPTRSLLTATAADGRFVIAGVPPGEVSVYVAGSTTRKRITVRSGEATDVGYLPPAK
ncbi:carboxypeptidase-like regulatory domain-containing protein [Myxococcus stipitatus]|uniref:carboxypeptidase-like regulatory domain-containing protein n=1 Tax=Myxococcus stipitatus TaxID=83455 RepID=UPI00314554A2